MQIFLVTLMLVHISSKKICLLRHSTYHLKAHRISNNMVLKLPVQRFGGKVMVITCTEVWGESYGNYLYRGLGGKLW